MAMVQRRRLNNGGYGGTLANLASGALQLYTGGNYRNYRRAAKLGMRAAQIGARGVQRAYRAYKARGGNSRGAARSAAAVPMGSATHGGTRSYGASRSRRPRYNRKRLYGRKRKGKGFRKGKGGGVMKYLRQVIMTPQVTKVTRANNYIGVGPGCRTWSSWLVNSRDNLVDMWARRPQPWFSANAANPAVASTQTGFGNSHKCCLTSFQNKFILQNRSNWDMELKVYECVLRRDHSFTQPNTTDLIGDWVLAAFQRSDSNVENKGQLQPGYAGAGDSLGQVERNPSYTPYMSNHFTNVFRVIKTSSFKVGMNDYVNYYVRVNGKKFCGPDISVDTLSGYQEYMGGWTKILLFTWVGGPVDDSTTGGTANQTKAQADLFVQCDITYKFYFEPRAEMMYNIASSNATDSQLGHETLNTYKTTTAPSYVAPATSVDHSATADGVPATHP